MINNLQQQKALRAYSILLSLIICSLAASLITAQKVVSIGTLSFPFATAIFSILTYPLTDCICELWGKQIARRSAIIGSFSQLFIALVIQLSIQVPGSDAWQHQQEYQLILASGIKVVIASFTAFTLSQLLDIFVYQRLKNFSKGKMLWLRSNISVYLGQALDSFIFVMIVFHDLPQKWHILAGAITIKIIISLSMTPIVYLIVMGINRYLDEDTLAFKQELAPA